MVVLTQYILVLAVVWDVEEIVKVCGTSQYCRM